MKVLIACPYAWEAPGGVQVHVRQLAEHLRARGNEVRVLAPGWTHPIEHWVRFVARPFKIPYNGTVAPIGISPYSLRAIRRQFAMFEPDIVHAHEPMTPSTSMYATLASPVPVVATFHAHLDRSLLLRAATPLMRAVWRRIAVSVAVSEAAASFIARPFGAEPVIVPNGVDAAPFREAEPSADLPEGRRILWVNRLDPQKGFPVALRAFEILAMDDPRLWLVVAGDGRDRDALRQLPGAVAKRVVTLGTVPHDELPAYFAAADVFVSPATGQESFGVVLLEAMAAGVPVVASDIPGYREVVRDAEDGLLVRPGDAAALAAALRRVLEEPALSGKLRDAGRERAAAFSWEGIVPRVEEIYARAARGSARRTA